MKTYIAIGIITLIAALLIAGVVFANEKITGNTSSLTAKTCGSSSCIGSCSATNNCGSASCDAVNGGSCTCGKTCNGSCSAGNTCGSETCGAKTGGSCSCGK